MSTLAAVTRPATAPTTAAASAVDAVPWIVLWSLFGGLACVSAGITVAAYFLGAFRHPVQGPPRVPPGVAVWPVAVGLAAALVGLTVGAVAGALLLDLQAPAAVVEEAPRPPSDVIQADEADDPLEMVKLMQASALAYLGATSAALLALVLARAAGWSGGIGLGTRRLPRGLLTGAAAILLVIPWMMTAAFALQIARKALGYPLDSAHELIRAIQENPEPQMIFWGFFSAIVIAPLAEEILFRGFLQTSLVYGLSRLAGGGGTARFEVVMPDAQVASGYPAAPWLPGAPLPPPMSMPAPIERHPPAAVWRWTGIVVTSVVFAALHEPWSIPLIFLLSLAFGYLYERTGSLWTSILVHFGFNTFNMLLVIPAILAS